MTKGAGNLRTQALLVGVQLKGLELNQGLHLQGVIGECRRKRLELLDAVLNAVLDKLVPSMLKLDGIYGGRNDCRD